MSEQETLALEVNTKRHTNPFDARTSKRLSQSRPGQASWGGEGPEGTHCYMCHHYHSGGYYAGAGMKAGTLKPGICGKYRTMMGRKGDALPPRTLSCRFYEGNPLHLPLQRV